MRRLAPAAWLLLAVACQGASSDAAKAVRAYDDALVRAYAGGDASPIANLATVKEVGRVQVLIDLKTAGKLVLESRIESFEVTSASTSGDTATVEVVWTVRGRSGATRTGRTLAREAVSGADYDALAAAHSRALAAVSRDIAAAIRELPAR